MTEATEHALEQAERIVQYAKYSDRFMVVEGDSAAERRAFVKLIGQKLPRQVRSVVLRVDSGNGSAALIDQLSTLLQLSAGIETIEQLIGATTAALDGQERLLVVVENADQWLASDTADTLFDLITQSHELARERILFLLVGASGLCEQAETAQPLAGLVADLHCAQLLGATQKETAAPVPASTSASAKGSPRHPAEYASATGATATPSSAGARTGEDAPRSTATSRPLWASPTLVIAAVISIAVVAIGVFALLGRSETPPPESSVAMSESDQPSDQQTGKPTASETDADEQQASDSEASDQQTSDTQANTADATSTEETDGNLDESVALVDHGVPPHVPSPEDDHASTTDDSPAEVEADTDTSESSDDSSASASASEKDGAEKDETTVAPVTEDTRGAAAATPPTDVDNNWFRDQPRARAAIQMAAFGKLDGAEAMIDRYATDEQPRDQWRIYTQSVNGQVLYTVTFGDFASAERAEHAIDSLPAALRGLEPYPRSVGAIQDRLVDATD